MFNLFKSLAKAFKPVVNTVNTVVQNIAKQYGSGWLSKGVQTVTDSVNKVAENPNNTGSSGYSSNAGSAPIVQGINNEDNDSVVKRAKRKKKGNSSPAPTQPDPIPEDVGVTTENPIVIYRSRDQKLTEAEEDQIDYLLAVEDDPLAKDMLLKIKNEGLPQDIEFADYMKQFAQWGWDDLSDEHAKAIMEIIMQDRADDQIESLVVFDEETGFVILDRIGIEGPGDHHYVGIQIEEIEMMRGRDIVMVHNHPGSLKASDEDLQVAWLAGAEKVIILTPEGFEYVYKPGKSGMEFVGKNDLPFDVAPPTLEEYRELQKLSQQQAISNYYNRPEYMMLQDGNYFKDDYFGTSRFKPDVLTAEQAFLIFEAYMDQFDQWPFSAGVEIHQQYLSQWNGQWEADPDKWADYQAIKELMPTIMDVASRWNHPGSGMSDEAVATLLIANIHQESRLRRAYPGANDFNNQLGRFSDMLGDFGQRLVGYNATLGLGNIRLSTVDEILRDETIPMRPGEPSLPFTPINDDQLATFNTLSQEWNNFSTNEHIKRSDFMFDDSNNIELMGMNFYRGVERLNENDLEPTMFNMSAWLSRGIPESNTLTTEEGDAPEAREHASQVIPFISMVIANEEFGLSIDPNDYTLLNDDDFSAYLTFLGN